MGAPILCTETNISAPLTPGRIDNLLSGADPRGRDAREFAYNRNHGAEWWGDFARGLDDCSPGGRRTGLIRLSSSAPKNIWRFVMNAKRNYLGIFFQAASSQNFRGCPVKQFADSKTHTAFLTDLPQKAIKFPTPPRLPILWASTTQPQSRAAQLECEHGKTGPGTKIHIRSFQTFLMPLNAGQLPRRWFI